jgi:hypothetical protein
VFEGSQAVLAHACDKVKGKAVPLHTMDALWMRGGIVPPLS